MEPPPPPHPQKSKAVASNDSADNRAGPVKKPGMIAGVFHGEPGFRLAGSSFWRQCQIGKRKRCTDE